MTRDTPTPRVDWHDLPEAARDVIETHTGPVLKAETVSAGRNSDVAGLVHTASACVFIKGIRTDHRRAWTQATEATVNRYVVPLAPRLLWHVEADGWNLLGFEHIAGRHADFSPGSPDLPKVAGALEQLAQIPCPDLPLKRLEQRLAGFVEDSLVRLLSGDSLLHTDVRPDNVLIADAARLVDWAWATRGPVWADLAFLVLQLIDHGHTPAEAEAWADQFPPWRNAPAQALDTFAVAAGRMWEQITRDDPQPWKRRLTATARTWAKHRLPV